MSRNQYNISKRLVGKAKNKLAVSTAESWDSPPKKGCPVYGN